ncbi:hypothetical protein [Fluviicola sp.]|uniref:HD domain-containing protein n=1 Tax=Fluviicola sp. TaxID=1917219 RepID=UPI0026284BE3|nr:hypothetical protein [Fluviicola sp.]
MLKEIFIQLALSYSDDEVLNQELWLEIEKQYSGKKRHYHTLRHLEHLLEQLTTVKSGLRDWNTILFTLFYHDVIYTALKPDNEEKSADLAEKRMKQLGVPIECIEACRQQILATKSHVVSENDDTNFFTDADLSVLGQHWEVYSTYFKNVRKEYAVYPDLIYNPGRKNVLLHFLAMERIFKTDYFFEKFEEQARENLKKEVSIL